VIGVFRVSDSDKAMPDRLPRAAVPSAATTSEVFVIAKREVRADSVEHALMLFKEQEEKEFTSMPVFGANRLVAGDKMIDSIVDLSKRLKPSV
jgi:hypothetical protein